MAKKVNKSRSKKKEESAEETLHDLLIMKLRGLHDVEEQLVKALPKMAKAAHDVKLGEAFTQHLDETKQHVKRLEEALKLLGAPAKNIRVEAIRGLVDDGEWVAKSIKNPAARDAALIGAAQYVEHYEMAGYGTAREWTEEMGYDDVVSLLDQTLEEESAANEKLNDLAVHGVNERVENGMVAA